MIFVLCTAFLLLTYVLYPLAVVVRARVAPRPPRASDAFLPHVTCIVAAHDEGDRLVRKVENLLAQDWPADRLEVVIADDGSRDGSPERARAIDPVRVRVASTPSRAGKPAALVRAVAASAGEVLVMADARQRFEPDAVRELVRVLADADVGAVCGRLVLEGDGGVGLYWRYESLLRRSEGAVGSVMGVTGAIYALRRSLFPRDMPAETVLDDVYVPMTIVLRGRRVAYAASAVAHDPELDASDELPRKVRTLAGNWQLVELLPDVLRPRHNPALVPFFLHKVARLLGPLAMAGALLSSALGSGLLLRLAFAAQVAFYGVALLPLVRPGARTGKLGRACHAFLMLNWAAVLGFVRWARGQASGAWATTSGRVGRAAR